MPPHNGRNDYEKLVDEYSPGWLEQQPTIEHAPEPEEVALLD